MVGKLLEQDQDTAFGFDAQTSEYADMVKAGIIDPTKVVRTGAAGRASVAGLLITIAQMMRSGEARAGRVHSPGIGTSVAPFSGRPVRGLGRPDRQECAFGEGDFTQR